MSFIKREDRNGFDWYKYNATARKMAHLIDKEDTSIIELCAGDMYLKDLLSSDVTYIPVDIVAKSSETVICDLNEKAFPSLNAGVIFAAEIMEYVEDAIGFISQLALCSKKLIFSYCPQEYGLNISQRRELGWLSDLSIENIITSLHEKGFVLQKQSILEAPVSILCFVRMDLQAMLNNYFCSGCGTCTNICPYDALHLAPDESGLYRPKIDNTLCKMCGLCVNRCPALHQFSNNSSEPDCYAFCAQDEIRQNASSGGAFPLLAKHFLSSGGFVAGASWNDDFGVQHYIIDSTKDLHKLCRSKYLQTNVGYVYRNIKQLLQQNRTVLFTGCPCHVAALYAYLGDNSDNLYTVDLLCAQSPSPKHFKSYLNDTFGENQVVSYDFRIKNLGWNVDAHKVILNDGTELIRRKTVDLYQQAYHARLMMPNFCERCRFCTFPRQGDISIGDFHEVGKWDSTLDDKKGTSVLLVNSQKGQEMLTVLAKDAKIFQHVPITWVMNNRVHPNFVAHPGRDRFFAIQERYPFDQAVHYALNNRYDIGVVGVWSEPNYGSELTYYALYEVLRQKGYDPLMIERPGDAPWKPQTEPVLFAENPYPTHALSPIFSSKASMEDLNERCDMFLIGSDQMWHPDLYYSFNQISCLDFIGSLKKKISYSTSFGQGRWMGDTQTTSQFAYYLSRFDAISVREESGVSICRDVFNIDAACTLDPVFLCDKQKFITLAEKSNLNIPSQYMAVYMLDYIEEKNECIQHISQMLELPIRFFTDAAKYNNQDLLAHINNGSVEDWLKNIINSDFVITDSFHGICFAILFRKQFIAVENKERGSTRFHSLLSMLGLMPRLVQSLGNIPNALLQDVIAYDEVYEILDQSIIKSSNWLDCALEIKKPQNITDFSVLENKLLDVSFQERRLKEQKLDAELFNEYITHIDRHEATIVEHGLLFPKLDQEMQNRFDELVSHLERHENTIIEHGLLFPKLDQEMQNRFDELVLRMQYQEDALAEISQRLFNIDKKREDQNQSWQDFQQTKFYRAYHWIAKIIHRTKAKDDEQHN